jgi:dipeptidyl aminopeptidase/acylaminoacyl peptidase
MPIPARPPVSASAATPVTTGDQAIEGIAVSRDGQWLAFDSNRSGNQDIYRMPLAGGEIEQLTTHPADDFVPCWSPDGKEIVFYSWRNGNRDLFLMAADGSSERQLTSEPGDEVYPDWSADGRQIVFLSVQLTKDTLALLTRTPGGHRVERAAGSYCLRGMLSAVASRRPADRLRKFRQCPRRLPARRRSSRAGRPTGAANRHSRRLVRG